MCVFFFNDYFYHFLTGTRIFILVFPFEKHWYFYLFLESYRLLKSCYQNPVMSLEDFFLSIFSVICLAIRAIHLAATLASQEKEIIFIPFVLQRYGSADQIPPSRASLSFISTTCHFYVVTFGLRCTNNSIK